MGATWIYAGAVSHTDGWPSVVGQALIYPAVLWRFGETARRSAELAGQLRREQAERARREVAEERGRIARELHDVVAHHIPVVSVQTGLARFAVASDPGTPRQDPRPRSRVRRWVDLRPPPCTTRGVPG